MDAQSGYATDVPERKRVIWEVTPNIAIQQEIEQVLSLDPRPAYQQDPNRIYGMRFGDWNVRFRVDDAIYICGVEHEL